MPSPTRNEFDATVYHKASSLPEGVLTTMEHNPVTHNCILPQVQKYINLENHERPVIDGQFWIVVTTYTPEPRVDFVLSCTESEMGTYPIFIASTCQELSSDTFILPRLRFLVECLLQVVDVRRVYSVFAPDSVALRFANLWTQHTGIHCYREPYYAAKLSFCTPNTFRNRSSTVSPGSEYILRPADEDDLHEVAELCYGFAAGSEPFSLDKQGAIREASILIRDKTVWIHEVRRSNETPLFASLVAFTRNSNTVSTITKVYTDPGARGMGCAQRLVRRVCKHLFYTERKEKVALYVAHNNPAASKVYHRVGFIGLDPETDTPSPEVESWTEFGFDRDAVELGHW